MGRVAVVVDADACVPESLRSDVDLLVAPPSPALLLQPEFVARLRLEVAPADPEAVAAACVEAAATAQAVLYVAVGDDYGAAREAADLARQAVDSSSPRARFATHHSDAALMGCGWQALAAARAVRSGGGIEQAAHAAEAVAARVSVLAVLEHPELAGAGGVAVPGTEGTRAVVSLRGAGVDVISRPRRREEALLDLRNRLQALAMPAEGDGALHAAVHHAGAGAGAEALATWIGRTLEPAETVIAPLTRHAATRLGPRMLGVAWYREPGGEAEPAIPADLDSPQGARDPL